jgi:hypothetical protein
MAFLRIAIPLQLFLEHDLFGKPVPTFPDHAQHGELRRQHSGPDVPTPAGKHQSNVNDFGGYRVAGNDGGFVL